MSFGDSAASAALKVGTLRLADDGTVHFSGVTSADEEFLRGLCVA